MFKEYQLEQYSKMKEDIIDSEESSKKIILTGDFGACVLAKSLTIEPHQEKELVKIVRKSYNIARSAGFIGMFHGARVYVIPDYPEKFSLIMEAQVEMEKRPLGYLGGDIMTRGSNLAREEEYQKFLDAELPVEVYSPVQNKSINDKSNMTEEENNHLAEKIVEADVERLWNSDFTVLCPEQSAIGTMCEMGILYGWKYMAEKLWNIFNSVKPPKDLMSGSKEEQYEKRIKYLDEVSTKLVYELRRILDKQNYAHYFDIRTNHLNEKDWRRSFSINQFLYGIILAATADKQLHNSFDEIIPILKDEYSGQEKMDFESEWR